MAQRFFKTRLNDGDRLLFVGDSITDCGRRDPENAPLGCGFVQYVAALLLAEEPEKAIEIRNRGIGGDTVDDLRSRWQDDVITQRPDWLCVKIGINDCNRHLVDPGNKLQSPENFRAIYRDLLEHTRRELPETRLLLVDPFYLSRDTVEGSYRKRVLESLPAYLETVREMADAFEARHVPLHEVFQKHLERRHPDAFCPEPVHPGSTGHMIIARAILGALAAE